jgi:hypothetical protein
LLNENDRKEDKAIDNKELRVEELRLEDLDQSSGGATLPETWKNQIRTDCRNWKAMGYSKERILRAYDKWSAAYPKIRTYINSIWDSL